MANKDIDPKLKSISEYLNIKERFIIPEYQRAYTWSIVQCDKLWQDIENYLESDNADPYFFGTIIIDCSNDNGELHLIDGQQRTTTFLLLLKALLVRIQEVLKNFKRTSNSEALEEGLKDFRNEAIGILYKADYKKRTELLKKWDIVKGTIVLQNNSINEEYKEELPNILEAELFDDAEHNCHKNPRRQKDNKYTNFFKNFKFFYEKLCGYSESQLNEFAEGFLYKCQVIEIRSWQTEQAITMFNSLNSTGLPLSDADIISAQMYSRSGNTREQFNNEWQDIVKRANILGSQKVVTIDSILQQYMYIYRAKNKEYVNELSGTISVTTPGLRKFYITDHVEILKNPLEQCQNFNKIAQLWEEVKDYPIVRLLLKFNDNAKIFLAVYLYRFEVEELTQELILDVCECLIRLFALLELVDSGYSSANFKSFLFGEAIRLVDEEISDTEIVNDFNQHIQKIKDKLSIKQLICEYDKNILVFLNEYLYAKEKGLVFEFADNVNIEHIMPASGHNIETIRDDAKIKSKEEFASIVNKLGNKILLEEDINKSIGKEWFKTKKQKSIKQKLGYKDSKYNLAHSLAEFPRDLWTKDDIDATTNKIAERMSDFICNAKATAEKTTKKSTSHPKEHAKTKVQNEENKGTIKTLKKNSKEVVTFSISTKLLGGAKKASVAGEFNNWDPNANPFRISKGVGTAKVELEKGKEYQYKFVINGKKWVNDPKADKQVKNEFGETNSVVVLKGNKIKKEVIKTNSKIAKKTTKKNTWEPQFTVGEVFDNNLIIIDILKDEKKYEVFYKGKYSKMTEKEILETDKSKK